ncbi:MAG: hypothetical protein KGH56_02600 [Patescibacteria group bacterium]|nr:hypothetical protein [Patescibacteria group bacterium]
METIRQNSFFLRDVFGRERISSLFSGLLLLGIAFWLDHLASVYAFTYSSFATTRHVGDLFLDNLPVVNLNFIIIQGALLTIVFGTLFVLRRPRYFLFSLKAVALFIAIRAFFISLTHVGIYPGQITPGAGLLDSIYLYYNFQTGFFFSGHTALTFLMAIIFWNRPPARAAFLSLSLIFGVAVLLAHIHYSIDVFAAPFMAYGIFKIAERLFPRDYELIESAL